MEAPEAINRLIEHAKTIALPFHNRSKGKGVEQCPGSNKKPFTLSISGSTLTASCNDCAKPFKFLTGSSTWF